MDTSNKKGNFEVQLTTKIENPRIQVINRMLFKRNIIVVLSAFDLNLDNLDLTKVKAFNNRNLRIPTILDSLEYLRKERMADLNLDMKNLQEDLVENVDFIKEIKLKAIKVEQETEILNSLTDKEYIQHVKELYKDYQTYLDILTFE